MSMTATAPRDSRRPSMAPSATALKNALSIFLFRANALSTDGAALDDPFLANVRGGPDQVEIVVVGS